MPTPTSASTPAPASTPASPSSASSSSGAVQSGHKFTLFVGNIPFASTRDELLDHFDRCGAIVECNVVTDKESGSSRGFGFVTFSTEGGMQSGLDLDGLEFMGRVLSVTVAKQKERKFRPPQPKQRTE